MLVLRPLLFFLGILWLAVSSAGSLRIHSAEGHWDHEHKHDEGISWIKDLQKRQRDAAASTGETASCFSQDAPRGDSAVELFKQINKCRVKDPRWAPHLPHRVVWWDLMQACDLGFYSPAYGKGALRSKRLRGDPRAPSTADGPQPLAANPRKEKKPLTHLFVSHFLNDLIEPLYGMIAANLQIEQGDGEPHKSRLYDFYLEDERFVAFLKDIEEERTQPGGFITLQDLEGLKKLFATGERPTMLGEENNILLSRLVFDAGVFHAFTLAKAMSRKLNFGIEFNEKMTVQAFADALRSYFDAVGLSWGGKPFSSKVLRIFEDVGFFSLAYLQCDGRVTQLDAKYDGTEFKAKLSECFSEEVDVFITSLLNIFNAWERAHYRITPEVLEQVRVENAEWAAQNKGRHLDDCE
ncbi:hypothetical protein PAPHI01_2388 [Pancytospora philotis]|nr:hypothetical protein PAPHI01_2388 [Pancytospora philotis]